MKDLISSIYNIFKYVFRFFAVIRNFVFNFFLILLLVAIMIAVIPKSEQEIPKGTLLKLEISGDIVEERRLVSSYEKLLQEAFSMEAPEPETSLQDILDIINNGAEDDRITALVLDLKNMGRGGINQLQTIGEALERFKETGKIVVAAEDYYTQTQYFLASFASRILVHPMGGVDIHGLGMFRLYFKDALEKLKVNYNVFKVGSFKSALEPFTRNSMSDADRLQNELWLSALWQVCTDTIVEQRSISLNDLHSYTDNISESLRSTNGNIAELALKTGLVDQVASRQDRAAYLKSLLPNHGRSLKMLSSRNYLSTLTPSYTPNGNKTSQIGLIIAEGNILPGKQPPGMIGAESLANLIKKARDKSNVKALVLRINSGGGSAFASEVIRQELLELKKSGKPLVISMGTLAASGGYWIAADADEIWASPATITGSIGIFGAIPTFEKTLASLGIYRDGVGTTPLASGLDLTQPLPEALKNIIQQTVVYNYNYFLKIVAEGRNIKKSRVASLAEGRVYDGATAKTLGLVDNLGTLDDAIEAAAGLADLKAFKTEYIRPPVSVKEHFMQLLTATTGYLGNSFQLNNTLGGQLKKILADQVENILLLDDPQGIYARCFINLDW